MLRSNSLLYDAVSRFSTLVVLSAYAESFRILGIQFCRAPHQICIDLSTFQPPTSIIASKHFKQAQTGEDEAI